MFSSDSLIMGQGFSTGQLQKWDAHLFSHPSRCKKRRVHNGRNFSVECVPMLPAITTTHAVPCKLPSGRLLAKQSMVTCPYCLSSLGRVRDGKSREMLLAAHCCVAKTLAKRP